MRQQQATDGRRLHLHRNNVQKRKGKEMIPTEIITAGIAAATTLSVCLINGHYERKKTAKNYEENEKKRIQGILDQMAAKDQERQAIELERQTAYMKQIEELKHALEKMNIKIENMEERIKERVDSLSRHVEKHNNFAERMPVVEEMIKVANNRISDLEDEVKELRHAAN